MRLLELTSNHGSFRSVRFHPKGLSLIVGRKQNPDDHDREHSFNGVGKSLLLYLVDFCLGSKENAELSEKLPGWEFTLSFEANSQTYVVSRSTDNQRQVLVNEETQPLNKFTEALGKDLFGLAKPVKYLTYRSLISQFIRQGKAAYMAHDQTKDQERQYAKQVRTSYLLGLDENLVDKKRELREEHERLDKLRKNFKNDTLLRDYFYGDRDAKLELKDLEEEIQRLESEKDSFRVAENYSEMVVQAEETRRQWRAKRNALHLMEGSLQQIARSLKQQPDVRADQVETIYAAAKRDLPDMVRRQLSEVSNFHEELIESRTRRLTAEKHRIERRIDELKPELQDLERRKDEFVEFLGSHGALDEYEALLQRLAEKKRQAERLTEYKKLEEEYRKRANENKLDMSRENVRTGEYLDAAQSLTEEISDRFRTMARRIYPGKTSGLKIQSNDGNNLLRFDIEPRIQADASDGIAETKLFCFDMTVLLGRRNHRMDFLMHDSRLYPNIDPRQRVELFRIAYEYSQKHDFQYIASLNQDNLESMAGEISEEEFKKLFGDNIVLELTDDSDSGKLLGISVDLDYGHINKTSKEVA